MAHCVLKGEGLVKSFGGVRALKGVSFHLEEGELLGLAGGNGAGKTTLFNVISGLISPDCGSLTLSMGGRTLSAVGKSPCTLARAGICRTFQNLRLFPHLTVEEHLLAAGGRSSSPIPPKILLEMTGLSSFRNCLPSSLSYPDRRKLEFARAIATGGRLLLLDEPAAAMNHTESLALAVLIREIISELPYSLSLLVIEHDMEFLRRLCGRMYVMEEGEILACGPCDAVLSNPTVQRALFG